MLFETSDFHIVFQNPFVGNMLLDSQMRVVRFNEAVKRGVRQFFGLEITEGTSFLIYAQNDTQREQMMLSFRQALQGQPVDTEFELTDAVGKKYRFTAYCLPIKNQNGEVELVYFSYFNVNKWQQATALVEEQLREALRLQNIYKALFENQPHANLFLSPKGELLALNRQAVALLQKLWYPAVTRETKNLFDALQNSSSNDLVQLIKDALENNTVSSCEREITNSEGRRHWIELFLIPVKNSDGSTAGIHVQIKDINQQKKTEDLMRQQQTRLRQSESQLRAVFDSSSDVNIFVGPDYRIISFNKHAVDVMLAELQKRLLPGLDIRNFVANERLEAFEQHFQAALRGQSVSLEVEVPDYKGERNWYRFTYTPVTDRLGTTIGVIINAININERKRNEEKILQQNEQIKEFAFLTAHRLRAPVASILGLLNLFDMDGENMSREDIRDIMQRLKIAAGELNHAVGEMNRSLEPLQPRLPSASNNASPIIVINDTARPLSIVLVDDDPIVNMVSKTLLQRNYPGVTVHTFLKAEEALQFLKTAKEPPALILLDIIMPEMNGWQFLQVYEQLPYRSPVCMLSSSLRASDREEAKKYASVADFILKPLDSEKIKIVTRFLQPSNRLP